LPEKKRVDSYSADEGMKPELRQRGQEKGERFRSKGVKKKRKPLYLPHPQEDKKGRGGVGPPSQNEKRDTEGEEKKGGPFFYLSFRTISSRGKKEAENAPLFPSPEKKKRVSGKRGGKGVEEMDIYLFLSVGEGGG